MNSLKESQQFHPVCSTCSSFSQAARLGKILTQIYVYREFMNVDHSKFLG